jgi:hypothetical protein
MVLFVDTVEHSYILILWYTANIMGCDRESSCYVPQITLVHLGGASVDDPSLFSRMLGSKTKEFSLRNRSGLIYLIPRV